MSSMKENIIYGIRGGILKNKSIKDIIYYSVIALIMSFIVVYLQEVIYRNNFLETSEWILNHKYIFTLNVIIIYLVTWILMLSICNLGIVLLIESLAAIILSTINHYKVEFKGELLTFSDFNLVNEAMSIVENYNIQIPSIIIIALVIGIICSIILFNIKIPKWKLKFRMTMMLILVGILSGYIFSLKEYETKFGLPNTTLIMEESYNEKGLLLGMIGEIQPQIKKPDDYSEQRVNKIINQEKEVSGDALPNIIIIMNESFFKFDELEGINVSSEIFSNLKEYEENFTSGRMITPVYGGGTSQVEYEVLTGYPTSNTGNRIVYSDLINEDIVSMVSILKESNYFTLAMHPYTGNFFKRNYVYEKMGFDRKIFLEDMDNPKEEGTYVSDRYLYNQLIQEYENRDVSKPFFSHIVTMQNHGGYAYSYDKYGIEVDVVGLDESSESDLSTYANLLKESDESLKYLIEYFSSLNEPTIIAFFGDHAPNLSNYGIINTANNSNEEYIQYHNTPLLIWDNMGLEKQELGYVSSYKVGSIILDSIGINGDNYFDLVEDNKVLSGTNNIFIKDGIIMDKSSLSMEEISTLNDLWILQYDRMFGRRYSIQNE